MISLPLPPHPLPFPLSLFILCTELPPCIPHPAAFPFTIFPNYNQWLPSSSCLSLISLNSPFPLPPVSGPSSSVLPPFPKALQSLRRSKSENVASAQPGELSSSPSRLGWVAGWEREAGLGSGGGLGFLVGEGNYDRGVWSSVAHRRKIQFP